MIPVYKTPFDDEYACGWITRMASANGFRAKEFQQFFLGHSLPRRIGGKFPKTVDPLSGYAWLTERYPEFPDTDTFLHKMTVMNMIYPFLSRGTQARDITAILYNSGRSIDLPKVRSVKTLCFCPECLEGDEEPYYRTFHQHPQVTLCPIHKCRLVEVKGLAGLGDEGTYNDLSFTKPYAPGEVEEEVSCFLYDLYMHPVETDISMVWRAVGRRLKALGMDWKTEAGRTALRDYIADRGYQNLIAVNKSPVIERLIGVKRNPVLLFTVCLFKTADSLKRYLRPVPPGDSIVPDDYHIVEKGLYINRYHHDRCGMDAWMHPVAIRKGRGCPYCGKEMTDEETLEKQLSMCGDGNYGLVSGWETAKDNGKVVHRTCGEKLRTPISRVIWEGEQCKCSRKTSAKVYQMRIDPGQRRVKVLGVDTNGNYRVKVVAFPCGHTFSRDPENLKRDCSCRVCRQLEYGTSVTKQIKAMTGEEYKILKAPYDSSDTIVVEHSICGTQSEIKIQSFLDGQRCNLCTAKAGWENITAWLKEYCDLSGLNYDVVPIGYGSSVLQVTFPDGTTKRLPSMMVMQELTRMDAPEVFRRKKRLENPPLSVKGQIYLAMKEAISIHGYASVKNLAVSDDVRKTAKAYLQKWCREEKITRMELGKYVFNDPEYKKSHL